MPHDNEQRATIIVNQSLASSNTFTYNLSQNIGFVPTKVIVRQMIYANIAGADNGTYLLWCSLTSSYIGAVYVGIQSTPSFPDTILNVSSQPSITFRLEGANSAYAGPSGQLTLTLECIRN